MRSIFSSIIESMILTWVLVSLAVLTSASPQHRGNVIFFPGERNSGTEENGDGLEVFYNNRDDKLWIPGNPDNAYNVVPDSFNGSDLSYEFVDDSEPFNFISEEDYFELPDWMDTDLNELSLDKLALLNNATNLIDLAEFFGLDDESAAKMSESTNRNQPDLESEARAASFVEKNDEMAKFAKCRPEKVTVELEVPKDARYLPTCVRLMRCGGCCNSPLLACQPTKVEIFSLIVMKITKGKKRPRRSRQRRGISGQMVSMPHENHVECSCQCKVQAHHCDPLLHSYNKDACTCVCMKEDEQRKCQESSILHKWDKKSCRCMCRKLKECSTGEFFSQNTCRCEVGSVEMKPN